jgi:hypothetical protein
VWQPSRKVGIGRHAALVRPGASTTQRLAGPLPRRTIGVATAGSFGPGWCGVRSSSPLASLAVVPPRLRPPWIGNQLYGSLHGVTVRSSAAGLVAAADRALPQGARVTEEQWRGGPTARRMLLGAQLRRLRTDAGLTRDAAGEAIRASAWKIHRLENGQVGLKERDVYDLLRRYGVTDEDEIDTFLALAREANQPGWWSPYSDLLPQWVRAYIDLEAVATLIRSYEALFVPGLLQTEDYAHALMRATLRDLGPDELKRRVEVRLARQQLLTRPDPPRLWVMVDEAALHRTVGGAKVLRAQVERLIEAAALPNVSLQVLPFTAGAYSAMVGAFSMLRFADEDLPDVVYVEHVRGALFLDTPADVEAYSELWSNAGLHGTPPEQASEVLGGLLRGLR